MKNTVATLPKKPGVYLFKDAQGTIVYVGKAKSLRHRVQSYFRKQESDWKIESLLKEATTLDHIETNTEVEALLLEAQLIQEHNPKFNVLLKSGQPFVYVYINREPLPQLEIVRNNRAKGTYFGPFIHKQNARSVYSFLMATFQLYCCNKTIENGCLDYHLGRCAGTCMSNFDRDDYLFRLSLATDVLRQDYKEFLKKLDTKIKEYTSSLEFEKARSLHNYRENIESIFTTMAAKYSKDKYAADIVQATEIFTQFDEDYQETAQELKDFLQLPGLPITIDCFDISHFQGTSIVGSCVRFTAGKPDKNKFRRFAIRTLTNQNDYAALHEIVSRRYKDRANLPDLVLIDGGKGQRNIVLPLLPTTSCISLAKREELIFSDNYPEGFPITPTTKSGKLLLWLRDYAHHFAISYHRLVRKKTVKDEYEYGKLHQRKSGTIK